MHALPKTPRGRASLALRMLAQAQHDPKLLETRVFSLLFEDDPAMRVLRRVNERLIKDPELARIALSPTIQSCLDESTLEAARGAQAKDLQPPLFP